MWDLEAGRRLSSPDGRHGSAAACLSPPGDRVITLGSPSISTWDSTTGSRLDSFSLPADPYWDRTSHTPYGREALSFVRDGEAYHAAVWDIAGRRKRFTLAAPGQRVPGPTAFSADGTLLATLHPSEKSLMRIWDVSTGKEVQSLKVPIPWGRVFFSADKKTLFAAGPKITAIDLASGKEMFSWRMQSLKSYLQIQTVVVGERFDEDNRVAWRALAVSPDASKVAAIHWTWANLGQTSGEDRLALYDLRTGEVLRHWNDSGRQANMFEALTFSPDGRLLASSEQHAIHVWEAASGTKVRSFDGHRAEINSLGFDRDSRRLVSASSDSTVVVWDLTGRLRNGKLQPCDLAAADLEARWRHLADRDAGKAYRAVWELTACGEAAVEFLKQHLRAVPQPEPGRITRLISELASDQFSVRQAAHKALREFDVLAENELRKVVQSNSPLELRRRIEGILKAIHDPIPAVKTLQRLRAIAVLEHVASAQARRLLQTLAQGAPAAQLTREARAALARSN
jgi:hypothetical protein